MKRLSRLHFAMQHAIRVLPLLICMHAVAGPVASAMPPRCTFAADFLPLQFPTPADMPAPAFELLRELGLGANADLFGLLGSPISPPLASAPAQPACACCQSTACPHGSLYWKSKPGVIWPTPYSRTALFFSSGLTWLQILETPPHESNTYLMLAQQYIAAVLNRAAGVPAPESLLNAINSATAWFSGGTRFDSCPATACATQKLWTKVLDTANHGLYARAVAACTTGAC